MFPLADTLRLPVFPSLRFRRNRTTFFYVSVKFPSKQTRVSARVNAWHPCGNARKRSRTSQFHVSVNVIGCNYCVNTSLRVGNWCFQVITILGWFSRHLQLQKPILSTFLLHKIIPQQSFQVLSLFFLLPKLTIRSSYGIYSLHWLS